MTTDSNIEMCQHVQLLGHSHYGVTELRTFEPRPMVAYADNEDDIVRLATELDGKVPGIYVGVQPRPLDLFDEAPNCWRPAVSNPQTNCGCDRDIEFTTACFFDIDVVSTERMKGYSPANCKTIRNNGFYCAKFGQCQVKAPMYLTRLFSIWNK